MKIWIQEYLQLLNDNWMMKVLATGFLYLVAFLFQGTAKLIGALIGLMILNMLTCWVVIVIQYRRDRGEKLTGWSIFRGIFAQAWQMGYLEREEWKRKTIKKNQLYTPLIIALGLAYQIVPKDWINLIYAFLGAVELTGIIKNLKKSGAVELEDIGEMLDEKKDGLIGKVTGGKNS